MEEQKEGIDIAQIINWIITIIFIAGLIYVVSVGWIGKTCSCQATYEAVCNLTRNGIINITNQINSIPILP